MMSEKIIERFMKFIGEEDENGCIPWLGFRSPSGHGTFHYNKKPRPAHRIAFEISTGIDPATQHVLHDCDNGWCVNPEHLHLGTHQDNMKEMFERKRNSPPPRFEGSKHPQSKLTDQQVLEIKEKLSKMTQKYGFMRKLADEYKVDVSTISLIYRKKIWKHILSEM